jgi:hypothetical protein
MNTGDKNIKGRAILKGPRGGLYVIGPSGAKISTFKRATNAAPAPVPNAGSPSNTFTHKGVKFTRVRNATAYGIPVYKKNGVDTYYTIPLTGSRLPSHMLLGTTINKSNGTRLTLRNYKKSKAAPRVSTSPTMSAALRDAIAHMNKLKTTAGRARHVARMRGVLSVANFAALERRAANIGVNAPAGPVTGVPVSASPRITTAERNVRLAAIRARLNAMRAEKLAAMPKRRANVEQRLRNAVARVFQRKYANRITSKSATLTVPFCHAPASVPRKACTIRKAKIKVYTSSVIDDGTMLATRASDIDLDWFKRQDAYVKNLSDYDFWTAQAHTNRSHSWIGPFLYSGSVPRYLPGTDGKHIAPLWPQVRKLILDGTFETFTATGHYFWVDTFLGMNNETDRYNLYISNTRNIPQSIMKRALEMYRDDLKRIIAGAPKSRKKMILYRGASFDIFRNTVGHWHKLESFCSASYDLNHALLYEGGTMQRITVLPGTPVLLVAGMNQWNVNGEYEIMVNYGTKYLIRQRAVKRVMWTGFRRSTRVTDVTIAK